MTSWEPIWRKKQLRNGFVHRVGSKLAAYGDLQRLVLDLLKRNYRIDQNTRVLEVGCGSGPVSGRLTCFTQWVYGVDISQAAVALTKRKGVRTAVADAMKLPFKENSFDLVFTTGVVDLFDDSQSALILGEIVRVTAKGGRIVVITAWSGCRIHEAVKKYLIRKNRWHYGPKRTFHTLEYLMPPEGRIIDERAIGALFQFRFLSYLFEDCVVLRRLYHFAYLMISIFLWPLNWLPGAVLATTVEKK